MNRQFYLDLAARGAAFPIGSDLVLRKHSDAEQILLDGPRLGAVLEAAAQRYRTPLALPVMDLTLEKRDLLALIDHETADVDAFHFDACPGDDLLDRLHANLQRPLNPRMSANVAAIRHIRERTQLVPVGMSIGPFSLMTKLLADPITPIYLAGSGASAEDDVEVKTVQRVLEMATQVVLRSVRAQIQAGAAAVFIAEPAACSAYVSPIQMNEGSDVFDRFPLAANRRVKQLLDEHGVDLIFHCCGELDDSMVRAFASLDPAVLSLGSSRKLWRDASLIPSRTVLYGNLPSKHFYSDETITLEQVRLRCAELKHRMREATHPFILGSECDILHVAGCEQRINAKALAICE